MSSYARFFTVYWNVSTNIELYFKLNGKMDIFIKSTCEIKVDKAIIQEMCFYTENF